MKKSIRKSIILTQIAERRWGPKLRWRCVYCGRGTGLQVDHFWPTTLLGTDERWNLFPACDRCNASKNGLDPWAWMDAVGVPERRQDAIRTLIADPSIQPRPVPNERYALAYEAARPLKRAS